MHKKELKYRDLVLDFDIDLNKLEPKDDSFISQERIEAALKKLTGMKSFDYNLYIAGSLSKNDKGIIKTSIKEYAKDSSQELFDYCYVNNFKNPKMPKIIKLKKGLGKVLSKEMDSFVSYLVKSVPNIFESKEYESRIQEIVEYYNEEQRKLSKDIEKKANDLDFVIKFSQMGITLVPIVNGKAVNEREFSSLSDSLKQSIEEKRKKLEDDLDEFLRQTRELEKEKQKKIKKINDEMGLFIVSQRMDEIKERFKNQESVIEYLDGVEEYTLNNIAIFLPQKTQQFPFMQTQNRFVEFKVNLFVDNEKTDDIPVIYEENPTYYNLFGKLEKQAYFGAFITDFTHIIAGSIHKANGGYLILDAVSVLTNPGVWDTLKKSLLSRKSIIEEWSEKYGIIASETLKPQPVDLDINIVLVGPEYIYDILYSYDEDFSKLFKIKTNFNHSIDKNSDNIEKFGAKMLSYCNKHNLKKPDNSGLKGLLKHSCRLSEDREKIWAYYDDIIDILRESQVYSNGEFVVYDDIEKTLSEKFFLKDLWRQKIYEMIGDGTIMLDLKGKKVGQINGLSVLDLGDFAFGRPNKITSKTYIGKEGVVNIERESKLSGKIFDKASFIISGYIGQTYGFNKTISFAASISFEQSYSYIEGDSASIAETVSLLSSLANIPIKQNLAVTGSMNQDGIVQPIGGVNEKIEGFFDICKLTGNLKGSGVVIPKQNIKNLILKDEVLDAIKNKQFHIYAIETLDDALEIFSGIKAGKRLKNNFEKDSFHYFVNKRFNQINAIFRKEEE